MNNSQLRCWFLAEGKQRLGPFTAEQFKQMVATGVIQPSDMVLEPGKQKWCPLNEVPALTHANGKPRQYAKMKFLGLTGTAATLVLGLIAATTIILIFGLWAAGVYRSKSSQGEFVQQANAGSKYNSLSDSGAKSTTRRGAEEHEHTTSEKTQKEQGHERTKTENEKRRKTALEETLRNAVLLQAPPLGNSVANFAQQMRKLATDEFTLEDARNRIYKATFDQTVYNAPIIKSMVGRNVLVSPGVYNFEQQRYSWNLYLWCSYSGQIEANGKVFPETWDYCQLLTTFDLDEKTARKWKEVYEAHSLSFTVWFRIKSVLHRSWVMHPHANDGVTLAHDLQFEVETIRVEPLKPRGPQGSSGNEGVTIRRFWRFAPEYGNGYFKQLPDGTWEERGKGDRALMGIWVERGRTAEYVELEDRKRGYLTRLGAGKAWIASIRDGKFAPSPNGNWENEPSGLRPAEKLPLAEKSGGKDGSAVDRKKDQAPQKGMQKLPTDTGRLPRSFGVPKGTRFSPVGGRR